MSENKGRPIKKRQGAGTPAAPEIDCGVLVNEIFPRLQENPDKATAYCGHLNKAFRIMKIDTVEAQAVYLAHAFVESDQFRQLTETQGSIAGQKWEDDPSKVRLNESALRQLYRKGGAVNPLGEYEFIGRGPKQVTFRHEYVEVIAMLEKTAEQYEAAAAKGDAKAAEDAALARKAVKDIRRDPRNAARPEYTFLFSTAYMKKFGADVMAAQVQPNVPWTGKDAASGWVAGGNLPPGSTQAAQLVTKATAYAAIHKVLMREALKKKKTP